MEKSVKIGKWRHFKGPIYEVIGVGKHSETLEEMVVYKHDGELWIRPKEMFLETIKRDGKVIKRFEFIGE
jgi:cyclomaltodextrinase / maltogenic alpha-amylase / neopullulanase